MIHTGNDVKQIEPLRDTMEEEEEEEEEEDCLCQYSRIPFHYLFPLYIYIYIYIYCHPKTDCFVVSQLFSVARHVGRFKLGLIPAQIYVRLNIILLSQQSTYISSGIIG